LRLLTKRRSLVRRLILLFFIVNLGTSTASQDAVHTEDYDELYPASHILTGVPAITQVQCLTRPFSIWIQVEWKKSIKQVGSAENRTSSECVQYFPSDNALKSKSALFYLSGDVALDKSELDELNNRNYSNNSFQLQLKYANAIASKYGIPYVHIARPGMYGSSGNTATERHSLKEASFVDSAVNAIKAKLAYQRFSVLGQSGGGGLVASLITSGRSDIDCAVLASGSSSLKTRLATSKSTSKVKFGRDTTGLLYEEIYDSIDYVDKISPDERRVIIMLADPEDEAVSYVSQREFYEKVKSKGIQITWIDSKGSGAQHHNLIKHGLEAAADCMRSKGFM
jgi:hypothetical protein